MGANFGADGLRPGRTLPGAGFMDMYFGVFGRLRACVADASSDPARATTATVAASDPATFEVSGLGSHAAVAAPACENAAGRVPTSP